MIILAFCLDPRNGETCTNGPFGNWFIKGATDFQIPVVSGFLESSLGTFAGLKGYISSGVEVVDSTSISLPMSSPPQTAECVLGSLGERTTQEE